MVWCGVDNGDMSNVREQRTECKHLHGFVVAPDLFGDARFRDAHGNNLDARSLHARVQR